MYEGVNKNFNIYFRGYFDRRLSKRSGNYFVF